MTAPPTPWTTLRDAREAQSLTQAALAARVGTSPATIRHLEAGRQRPSLRRLQALADALDMDAGDLLRGAL